jgi:hypothetical protein
MFNKIIHSFIFVSLAVFCGFSCGPNKGDPKLIIYPTPYLPIQAARSPIVPWSQYIRLAVFNFVDQTGKAGSIVETLAENFATELKISGRFEIHDRGQLRYDDFTQTIDKWQKNQKHEILPISKDSNVHAASQESKDLGYLQSVFNRILEEVDGVLFGSVSSISGSSLSIDVRIVNARSFTVLFAGSAKIQYESGGGNIKISRDDVIKVVKDIKTAFPPTTMKIGKILVQDGPLVTINIGKKDGVIPGLNIFVVTPGSLLKLSEAPGQSAGISDEIYLAEAYVVSVFENTSKCIVYRGKDFRVGDEVRFK